MHKSSILEYICSFLDGGDSERKQRGSKGKIYVWIKGLKKKKCKEMKRNRLWKKGEGGSLMHDNVPASFGLLVNGARRDTHTHVLLQTRPKYTYISIHIHTYGYKRAIIELHQQKSKVYVIFFQAFSLVFWQSVNHIHIEPVENYTEACMKQKMMWCAGQKRKRKGYVMVRRYIFIDAVSNQEYR